MASTLEQEERGMESTQTLPVEKPRPTETVVQSCKRFFFTGSATLLFLFMLWGFSLFYLHGQAYPGRPLTPPIRPLLIAHGVAMTAWMVLFIVQPLLIATANYRTHKRLGLFGAGLAAAATLLGIGVAMGAARVNPPELKLWGLDPRQFMLVSLSAIVLFGLFVTAGLLNRRKPDVHKPMMLLASLSILPPSLDRITVIHNQFSETILGALFGAYCSALIVGLALLCLHWVLFQKLNRCFAIGYGIIALVAFATMQLAPTSIWAGIAGLMVP